MPRDLRCHPEERSDEGSAFRVAKRRRGALAVTAAVVVAALGMALGLALLCYRPNAERVAVLDRAAAQITEAEHARSAATRAVESAKVTAHVAGLDRCRDARNARAVEGHCDC